SSGKNSSKRKKAKARQASEDGSMDIDEGQFTQVNSRVRKAQASATRRDIKNK
ncbi:hypothetical protein KIPB_014197, partial [Kipferlia bialata]